MILKNLKYGTCPSVVHCPGRSMNENIVSLQFFDYLRSMTKPQIKLPPNLTMVTWNSKTDASILELQCAQIELPLTVLGRGVKQWRNGLKGPLLIEFAKSVKTEFILAMDAHDVAILNNLNNCITAIKEYGCDALFGGEVSSFPSDEQLTIFDNSKYQPPWRYLNSGMMIAKTDFITTLPLNDWGNSDQKVWRLLQIDLWPKIKIDNYCIAFQNINFINGCKPPYTPFIILKS